MKLINLSIIIIILFTSFACQKRPNETAWGLGMGGVMGGATYLATKGKNKYTAPLTFAALITGTMIGKTIGGAIDDVDEMKLKYALNKLPDDHSLSWDNPNTNNKIEVKPTKTYKEVIPEINNEQVSWCRKVDWKISHNGQSSFGETTVCRNTITGEWEPIISMSTM